jgi:hypothetical protein
MSYNRLGVVLVSMLANGPKVCGLELGKGDGFLGAIRIRQHTFLSDGK